MKISLAFGGFVLGIIVAITASIAMAGGGTYDMGNYFFPAKLAAGTTTPNADVQFTTASGNATSTAEIGKTGQNKGSCIKMYRYDGAAVYLTVNNSNALVVSTIACKAGI